MCLLLPSPLFATSRFFHHRQLGQQPCTLETVWTEALDFSSFAAIKPQSGLLAKQIKPQEWSTNLLKRSGCVGEKTSRFRHQWQSKVYHFHHKVRVSHSVVLTAHPKYLAIRRTTWKNKLNTTPTAGWCLSTFHSRHYNGRNQTFSLLMECGRRLAGRQAVAHDEG